MKKTAPRINDLSAEFLPTIFSTLNNGCESIIDSFPNLFRRTLAELKGKFAKNELQLLIDIHNGHFVTPAFVGQALLAQCEDAINLDRVDRKRQVDRTVLINKIIKLTTYQAAVLEFWATGFWYSDNDIDEYINALN